MLTRTCLGSQDFRACVSTVGYVVSVDNGSDHLSDCQAISSSVCGLAAALGESWDRGTGTNGDISPGSSSVLRPAEGRN